MELGRTVPFEEQGYHRNLPKIYSMVRSERFREILDTMKDERSPEKLRRTAEHMGVPLELQDAVYWCAYGYHYRNGKHDSLSGIDLDGFLEWMKNEIVASCMCSEMRTRDNREDGTE